ncbi:antibiotic biosynthesis monooxygenase family protein [Formosa sp. 4Alg 33]|uniref:antibiotic biosynthesis monooxygenase family protein n=1 Tax=Formosa sp. 4Alg 33 TaxID=3382189 RepID=UPI003D9BFEDB
MILEVAILEVKPGFESRFEKDFNIASAYISAIDGYLNHKLKRCIEQKNKYILLVEWDKLEDHTIGFRQSEHYLSWKNILHHYYEPFPVVEHFETTFDSEYSDH